MMDTYLRRAKHAQTCKCMECEWEKGIHPEDCICINCELRKEEVISLVLSFEA